MPLQSVAHDVGGDSGDTFNIDLLKTQRTELVRATNSISLCRCVYMHLSPRNDLTGQALTREWRV